MRFFGLDNGVHHIEDHLYLGGAVAAPPPGTRAVVNLCEKEDPYGCEFHLWEPIADSEPAPSLDWLRRLVDLLDEKQRAGVTTYVHCRNGVSRSGMLVVAYEMRKNRWTPGEALAFVRSKRPIVRPNPAFMRLLREWEGVVKDERVTSYSGLWPSFSLKDAPSRRALEDRLSSLALYSELIYTN